MNKKDTAPKSGKLRQAAELLLKKKKNVLETSFSNSDTSKIIHELEVHQVELEMQNEELKRAREKAEYSEKRYTELYDFAPSGYLTLTKNGEIIDLNYSAEQLLGKERSLLIKSSFGFFVSLDTRAFYNRFLQKIFKTKLKESCELKLETGDGSIKYVLVNGIISNIDEKFLITLVDYTKRKLVEFELINAKKKAEENERLKSSFLANMSHEIRTPMNGILGFTDLLKNLNLNGDDQQNYISIIEKSGIRMLNIINDIINISKIESQQIEVSVSKTNVNDQVEYIYHFFKLEAELKKLHISYNNELSSDKAFIMTDREKVYAVLTNLVKNAIKFTQTGSVELGYTKKKDFFEFYVKDSGPGIPADHEEIIFGRFMQSTNDLTRIYEGAGLGLSISKSYVEMLGGKIWVENNEAKNGSTTGATFFFTIPALPVKKPKADSENNPFENGANDEPGKLNILVVENDEISKMLLITMVEGLSRKILKARTGVEAVDVCQENPDIDLVLMDINMPEMDGYEATREIRKFNKDVIIIAQTAYALVGDREKAIAAGCNNYISKPISRAKLRKMIRNYSSEKTMS
ncbi:PAS domain-containing hybrid sensor histidine kinase/response regulator [Marinilabilia sp.]|uniref:PAS domain-containing hybrid sensor histidine kinase/response regulator n=1 Tax=Marinilabilia sp. TaxID=2021252 RepID=UPI0025C42E8D|nr:PAS domain-containing hybrid sensor histidine kinase/response regulator [Marinilabilia sp.]